MPYARTFFDLQWRLAEKVVALGGIPISQALLEYTNLYIRFGCGRDFMPDNPVWRAYLRGLEESTDPRQWTYDYYRLQDAASAAMGAGPEFGCFSYTPLGQDRIRLHFQNKGASDQSSLSCGLADQRRAELRALMKHVRQIMPETTRVVGASWLYNLDAYCRLFPRAYISTARVLPGSFRYLPLWGQFLDRHGETRPALVQTFDANLKALVDLDGLERCFPFQVLAVEAPVSLFLDDDGQ